MGLTHYCHFTGNTLLKKKDVEGENKLRSNISLYFQKKKKQNKIFIRTKRNAVIKLLLLLKLCPLQEPCSSLLWAAVRNWDVQNHYTASGPQGSREILMHGSVQG